MGQWRDAWRKFKKQFDGHLAPILGKDWVRRNFDEDLGPKLDELEKLVRYVQTEYSRMGQYSDKMNTSITAANEVNRIGRKIEGTQKKLDKLADQVLKKHASYREKIRAGGAEALARQSAADRPRYQKIFDEALQIQDVNHKVYEAQVQDTRLRYIRNAKFWGEQGREAMKSIGRT